VEVDAENDDFFYLRYSPWFFNALDKCI
jgi:hypothetical protein